MFDYMTTEHSYEPDRCTQPLIEEHPDYCVIYAGINDAILRRPTYYYTGSIRSIIRLLLHNGIRPVVMEMPKFSHPGSFNWRPLKERAFILVRGLLMGTWYNDVSQYRMALKDMLTETGLQDSILYIPTTKWNPKGCEDAAIYIEDQVHLNLDGYMHILDGCSTQYLLPHGIQVHLLLSHASILHHIRRTVPPTDMVPHHIGIRHTNLPHFPHQLGHSVLYHGNGHEQYHMERDCLWSTPLQI